MMSKRIFIYITVIIASLSAACLLLPNPYSTLLSTFLVIAYAAYLILLARNDQLDFTERNRKRIKLCAWLAIGFSLFVFFSRLAEHMFHEERVDPKGITIENLQRN